MTYDYKYIFKKHVTNIAYTININAIEFELISFSLLEVRKNRS